MHTKGNWEVLSKTMIIVKNPISRVVAETTSSHLSKAETEANARLIAAAPELLEALGNLLLAVKKKEAYDGMVMSEAKEMAEQAIAKAKT